MAEGGQRCSSHARIAFQKASQRRRLASLGEHNSETTDPSDVDAQWENAAVEYASTPDGQDTLRDMRRQAEQAGDEQSAALYTSILTRGATMREANAAVADHYHDVASGLELSNAARFGTDAVIEGLHAEPEFHALGQRLTGLQAMWDRPLDDPHPKPTDEDIRRALTSAHMACLDATAVYTDRAAPPAPTGFGRLVHGKTYERARHDTITVNRIARDALAAHAARLLREPGAGPLTVEAAHRIADDMTDWRPDGSRDSIDQPSPSRERTAALYAEIAGHHAATNDRTSSIAQHGYSISRRGADRIMTQFQTNPDAAWMAVVSSPDPDQRERAARAVRRGETGPYRNRTTSMIRTYLTNVQDPQERAQLGRIVFGNGYIDQAE
jgi:hypothetical protein